MLLDRRSGYQMCETEKVIETVFIPVRIRKGDCSSDKLALLIDLVSEAESNKVIRDQGGPSETDRAKVVGLMKSLVRRRLDQGGGHYAERDVTALFREIEPYRYFFTRVDCNKIGLELQIVDPREGGPTPLELLPLRNLISFKLGAERCRFLESSSLTIAQDGVAEVVSESANNISDVVDQAS